MNEYPIALAISPNRWAISDGTGRIYIIRVDSTSKDWTAAIESSYELIGEGQELMSFRLHAVDVLPAGEMVGLLSTTAKLSKSTSASSSQLSAAAQLKLSTFTVFDYLFVTFNPPSTDNQTQALSIRWQLRSHDLPSFVTFLPDSQRFIIGSPTPLFDANSEQNGKGAQGRRDVELNESEEDSRMSGIDSNSARLDSTQPPSSLPRPPPFSWTQDKESVTLVFAVPSDTPTSSIRATFSRQFLSVIIGSAQSHLTGSSSRVDLPRVSHKKLWDVIDPHSSVWTFDREAEGRDSTYGLLSLHLEKGNAGTRWSDVFASSPPIEGGIVAAGEEAERKLEHVAETMDPSELAIISESMEQWTKDQMEGIQGGGGEHGEGMGMEMPTSLMGEEIDVEVDGDSGRGTVITWVEDVLSSTGPTLIRPHPTVPYSLLSLPIPLASPTAPDHSIVIKHDVDGVRFNPMTTAASTYTWTHLATFPALAFVLATKRDAHFIYHLDSYAVFAFDSPSNFTVAAAGLAGRTGAGNLFVYFNTVGKKDIKGKQWVLRVGGPQSGGLMGVAAIRSADGGGGTAVMALCEQDLVIFRCAA